MFERVPFLNCDKDLGQLDSCGQIASCSVYDDYLFSSAVPVSLFGDSFSLEVAGSFVPVW